MLLANGASLLPADDDGFTPLDDAHDRRAFARLALKCACARQTAAAPEMPREIQIEETAAFLEAAARMDADASRLRRTSCSARAMCPFKPAK